MEIEKDIKCIFVSWEKHTRSRSIARALDISIFEVIYDNRFFIRYICSALKTLCILRRERPDIVIFQNPSIVLAVFLVVYSFFVKLDLVMDAHNAAINPLEGRFWVLNKLSALLIAKVNLTIVTNELLVAAVKENNGRAFVLEDPIPKFVISECVKKSKGDFKKVVFVCSWAKDEPYMEVIEAARSLSSKDIVLFVTGNPPKHVMKHLIPDNLKLTGYLLEQDYVDLLAESNLIVDLTDRSDCLVCGGYEAAAVGTPCILSDNLCSSQTFSMGYLYSNNDSNSLKESIIYGVENEDRLRSDIERFRSEYEGKYDRKLESLKFLINSIVGV
ncbi:glycosyltransferase [Marinobacter sp. SBS5]|uniref:glycosyltransferase n=1 Tax=Marinobacter sp. SBS5 TaxID=3401754 RepID=UPI003AAEF9C0